MVQQKVYYSPVESPPYPSPTIKFSYKQFNIEKHPDHNLYYVCVPDGYDLVASLAGQWTAVEKLRLAIDHYLTLDGCSVETAFTLQNAPPKRGRPFSASKDPKNVPISSLLEKEADKATVVEEREEGIE